jgi:transcriptional regulator with XRE-family HTH domain
MLLLSSNVKYLRKARKVTLLDVGDAVGVSHNAISNYENGKFFPTADVLVKMCEYFNVSADDLLLKDLASGVESNVFEQISTTEVSNNVWIVAEEQVQYARKWGKKYARDLTYASIPEIEGEARTFEVWGNSMNPILLNGDYVVCTPCSLAEVSAGQIYAIVVGESLTDAHPVKITYAQVEHGRVMCIPANGWEFTTYYLDAADVKEVWKAEMRITRNLSDPRQTWDIAQRLAVLEEWVNAKFPDEKLR